MPKKNDEKNNLVHKGLSEAITFQTATGPDAGEKVELLADGQVEGPEALAHRSHEWALQTNFVPVNGLYHLSGQRHDTLLIDNWSVVNNLPLDRHLNIKLIQVTTKQTKCHPTKKVTCSSKKKKS